MSDETDTDPMAEDVKSAPAENFSKKMPEKGGDVTVDQEHNENAVPSSENHPSPSVENLEYELKNFNMNNKERGVAIIFNNTFEKATHLPARKGTKTDGYKIYNLLDELGFEQIIEKVDVSVADMKKELEKVSDKNFKEKDCFVCVILSYGDEGYVIGKDYKDKIEVAELTKYFRGDKVMSLATKPKLFFIQTCPIPKTTGSDGEEGDVKISSRKIPVEANFLVLHSCIPGNDIWKEDAKKPSFFIKSLVKVVRQYRSELDFLSIMTRLINEMKQAKKHPYVSSTLLSDLFFK